MKKFYFITCLIAVCMFMLACGGNKEDNSIPTEVTINCNVKEINAPATGGQYTIEVACSKAGWDAFVDASSNNWYTLTTQNSAEKNGKVNLTIKANTTENDIAAKLVIKSGPARCYIPVTVAAPMSVSNKAPYSISKGETITVTVKCSGDWKAESKADWITATKVDNATLSLTTAANEDIKERKGEVVVSYATEQLTIVVTQNGNVDDSMVVPEGYHLVWNDEFEDGSTLDPTKWTHEVQGAGWVNNELQTYVNGKSPKGKRVTELVDGKLRINCFKEDSKIYSGRVYANRNVGFKYGWIEAKIKLPKGKGTWPAWWMMPVTFTSWPHCGEIDIMEEVGADPNEVSSSIHCTAYNHTKGTQKTHAMNCPGAEGEFHVYALEWTADYIQTYVDGKKQLYFANDKKNNDDTWPFHVAFYPILNLAWGGDWGGYKGVDESKLPVTMEVEYVRVFQK